MVARAAVSKQESNARGSAKLLGALRHVGRRLQLTADEEHHNRPQQWRWLARRHTTEGTCRLAGWRWQPARQQHQRRQPRPPCVLRPLRWVSSPASLSTSRHPRTVCGGIGMQEEARMVGCGKCFKQESKPEAVPGPSPRPDAPTVCGSSRPARGSTGGRHNSAANCAAHQRNAQADWLAGRVSQQGSSSGGRRCRRLASRRR